MSSNLRRLLATLVGNTLIAGFLTALGVGAGWAINLLISQCIGCSIYVSCSLAGQFVAEGPRRVLAILAAVPVGVAFGLLLGVSLSGVGWVEWPAVAWQAVVMGVTLGVMGSGFFYLRERNVALAAEVHQRENRRLEAEKRSIEAQLKMLQAQIEPHFLFNSLANVAALIEVDPKLAGRLLDALIRYLRSSLARTRAEGGTLADEVALLTAYLEILKIRMGDRLAYAFEIAPELLAHAFPPMLLQPLVENAIRHGLEPKVAGGCVTVSARRQGDRLQIAVNDDGLGFAEMPGEGIGVANIRARLAALYGPTASLELSSEVGAGATATMSVPVEVPA
ncbi:MAG: senson histidine kinase [Rhodocyclaceae bacterium]|nr:MAG: senson histidine kinase [Rhodocyclaceae bacterium]TND01064.1 MAG: senson histidine kinase [Rhodocyclaceae bacterium]